MVLIRVPRPPASAINPTRPVNALLMAQIMHLQEAERRLPVKYHTDIYVHAIKTEGEAAEYIRAVTEAIHEAHGEAAFRRTKRIATRGPVFEIAAAAEDQARRAPKSKKKSTSGSRTKRKK